MRWTSLALFALLVGCNAAAGLDDLQFADDAPATGDGGSAGEQPSTAANGGSTAEGGGAPVSCSVGDPASGDADADGLCDDADACFGFDNDHDADGDGYCDDADICPGQRDLGDGTCELDVLASTDSADVGLIYENGDYCGHLAASWPSHHDAGTWNIQADRFPSGSHVFNGYLTFHATRPVAAEVLSASLSVMVIGHQGNAGLTLHGAITSPGWETLSSASLDNTSGGWVKTVNVMDASPGEAAHFAVDIQQISEQGVAQFRLAVAGCPAGGYTEEEQHIWWVAAPSSDNPPVLTVVYRPGSADDQSPP